MMPLVTIDGPAGVGKTSVSRAVAAALGYRMLPSGRIYRAMAWCLLQAGWQARQPPDHALLGALSLHMDGEGRLFRDGEAVDAHLGSEPVSHAASQISADPAVRERANAILRHSVQAIAMEGRIPGVILEGRDMGTVVFPDAPIKFFLTADADVRAERRFRELAAASPQAARQPASREEVAVQMQARDQRDTTREVAPLRPADDARMVDTTDMSLDEVVAAMLAHIQERLANLAAGA